MKTHIIVCFIKIERVNGSQILLQCLEVNKNLNNN